MLTLENIHFDEEFITVNINAINGASSPRYLAWRGQGGAVLEDNTGVKYPFLPPEDNEHLQVNGEERLSGSLIFVGKLRDGATSLSLTMNPDSPMEQDESENKPYFIFESINIQR